MSFGYTTVLSHQQSNSNNQSLTTNTTYQTIKTMASQTHVGGASTSVAQQNAQGVTQQQLQLQQPNTTTTIQGAHQQGAQNQMQPLQVIQQQLQNQTLMNHQFYNTQGQLLMPGNIAFHPGLNPQIQQAQIAPSIQVISAGKTLQQNQLSTPHMFAAATSYTIPTSASNNQAYIIGQLNSHPSILQQQQTAKPGEMQKVIQPQIGTTTQIPQSIWAIPQFLNQNSILIRGTQPDQMFIQQQQPLHNNTSAHQHFTTMPLTTGQLPATSISSATTNGVQQVTQQQAQIQQQNHTQQQSQQSQSQSQPQIATIASIKTPATLQPKPPLQIQPQPTQSQTGSQNQQQSSQQQHQSHQMQQQLSQLQQVTMAHQSQVQMIPQPVTSSHQNMLQQQILAPAQQTLTAQVMQQTQQSIQPAPRQLTILPQSAAQQIQPQPVTLIQQQSTQQPQPIRPNYSATPVSSITSVTQSQGLTTPATSQQRAKMRKPGVGRGNTSASPTQQAKVMFPRPTIATTISTVSPQGHKPNPSPQQSVGASLTKVPIPPLGPPQSAVNIQPLKTINLAALHTPPTLPDATLTPLMPQTTSQAQNIQLLQPQPVQVFQTTTTQLPSPNISITPTALPPKKEDSASENVSSQRPPTPSAQQQQQTNPQSQQHTESKSENEKENTKTEVSTDDSEESTGKHKLPKALVKPQVLTHVIEGFVIQEASEPFPLGRNGDSDEPPLKKVAGEMGKCEMCGKVDFKSKFKKNKRFCSSQCAKGMKAQQQQQQPIQPPTPILNSATNNVNERLKSKGKRWGEGDSELTDETCSSVGEPSLMSPSTEQPDEEPKVNPVKWNVSDVVDFVRSLPGCAEYADDFALQEIDGQALMLLKEDHLMSAMGMKLGPALKLCAKIDSIKAGMGNGNGDGIQGKS